MIDPESWMPGAAERLRGAFGERLLYLGLQGSRARGEATEDSDIDLVALVSAFTLADLDAYRAAVRSMPEGEKACGFFSGREELAAWPRHELVSLKIDTVDHVGRLDAFLPPLGRADIADAARNGAAALYHPLVHTWLYGDGAAKEACARGALKGAFFLLRILLHLRTGEAPPNRKALCGAVDGDEKTIALAGLPGGAPPEGMPLAAAYELLIAWTRRVLAETD